jgi:hypothetical protein
MVEYAILVAHNTAGTFSMLASDVSSWISRLEWSTFLFALLAAVLVRMAFGAFRRSH